MNTIDNHVLI